MHVRRVLICGPVIENGLVGGLQTALADLASGLTRLGWRADLAISPQTLNLARDGRRGDDLQGFSRPRWSGLPRLHFLPPDVRTLLQHLLLGGGVARVQSDVLRALHDRLREVHYDAVIACVSREAPGLARFITYAHPRVLILSLNGLASELRLHHWLPLPRILGRIATLRRLHPDMYRGVDPQRIRMAVFASEAWYEEAVRAGLPPSAGAVIYFGLPHVPPLGTAQHAGDRLLWVGRLSPEKGLHRFVEAVALLRRKRPVVLTAICGQGPEGYRRRLVRRIGKLGLSGVVELRPPVPREELGSAYQAHDVLLFDSPFAEPVALVMLEAFAAGLPVVAPLPLGPARLLRAGETCVCYRNSSPEHIARAVEQLLDDAVLRERVRRNAHDLARTRFSFDATARAFDDVLNALLERPPASPAIS